jgi:hypothetical protein
VHTNKKGKIKRKDKIKKKKEKEKKLPWVQPEAPLSQHAVPSISR